MPHLFLFVSQSDYLIQVVDTSSYTWWQTVQIQISWLLQKTTDLDLLCLQRQTYSGLAGPGLTKRKDKSACQDRGKSIGPTNIDRDIISISDPNQNAQYCSAVFTLTVGLPILSKQFRPRSDRCHRTLHLIKIYTVYQSSRLIRV